jgi:hypothetical protein
MTANKSSSENEELPAAMKETAKYHFFTRNITAGCYGFFFGGNRRASV